MTLGSIDHTVKVNINKLVKCPSQVFEDLGSINLCDNEDIEAFTEEVMADDNMHL